MCISGEGVLRCVLVSGCAEMCVRGEGVLRCVRGEC